MSNSSLVTYTRISPHKKVNREREIDTITIHCYVGQVTAKQGCDYFATTKLDASSNYVVGKDGSIGLAVEEKDRAFTSSNRVNDSRAVTIEVASDTKHPYAVTDAAYSALIELVADICKRNNIKELKWKGDKSLIGQIDEQNMTVHCWFANKACPGEYLLSHHSDIANKVNEKLNSKETNVVESGSNDKSPLYRVRKTWEDVKSQIGAYKSIDNAKRACIEGYNVYDEDGNEVFSNKVESVKELKKGDIIKLKEGATYWDGKKIPSWVFTKTLYYRGISNTNCSLISTLKTGDITGVVTNDMIVGYESSKPVVEETSKIIEKIAREVIAGKWGNGPIRSKKLTEAGYNASEVQKMVNKLLK